MRACTWNVENNFTRAMPAQRDNAQAVIARIGADLYCFQESRPASDSNWDTIGTALSLTITKMGIVGSAAFHQFVWATTSSVTIHAWGHLDDLGLTLRSHFERVPAFMRCSFGGEMWLYVCVHNTPITSFLADDSGMYLRGLDIRLMLDTVLSYQRHYEAETGTRLKLVVLGDFNDGHPPDASPQYPQSPDFTVKPSPGDYPSGYGDPYYTWPVLYSDSGASGNSRYYPFRTLEHYGMVCNVAGRTGDVTDETTFDSVQAASLSEDVSLDFITYDPLTVAVDASEVYDSAGDSDPPPGMTWVGSAPATTAVTIASDHYPVVADLS